MEQRHKIAEAVFNIAFAAHGQMLERSGMLAGLVHDRLAPRISDVFDAWDTGPEVVRIDRLEIDLGTVAYDDLEAALTERLGQALQNALQTRPTATNTAAPGESRRVSAQQNDLDLMAHYLSTGRLPWWAERRSQADVTRTLSDLIDKTPCELTAYLRQQSDRDNPVLSRLVRQFEPGLVRRLIARLAPSAVQTIELHITALLALHTAGAILPLQSRELAWAMWETLLRRLLAPAGAHHSADTRVAAALHEVGASYQLHPALLLQNMRISSKRIGTAAQGGDLKNAIGNLLACLEMETAVQTTPQPRQIPQKALTPPFPSESSHGVPLTSPETDVAGQPVRQPHHAPHKPMGPSLQQKHAHGNPLTNPEPDEDNLPTPLPPPEAEQALAPQSQLERSTKKPPSNLEPGDDGQPPPEQDAVANQALISQLSQALTHPRLEGFDDARRRLLAASPEAARALIRHHARQKPVRQALARHLSQHQFHDIFEVIEPHHADFLAVLVDHLAHFQPAVHRTSTGPALVPSQFREMILTYLLEQRTTRFSPEHCCTCTIHRLAVHYDVAYTELLHRIRASIARSASIEEKTRRQLQAVLDSLQAQTGRSATRPPHGHYAPLLSQSDSLANRLRYIPQDAPLSERVPLHPEASDTGPAGPTHDIPAKFQDLPDRLGPEQVPALHRLLKRLPAARRTKLVEWLRQGAKRPETKPAKGSPDTTKINPSDDWAALLATLAEEKPEAARANGDMAGQPEHLPASADQNGVNSNDPIAPPPRLSGPSPHDATTTPVASAPRRKAGGSDDRPVGGNAEARHCRERHDFHLVQSTRFETAPSIYVQNAGMVLAAPFLPRLFGMLDLLEEKSFKNRTTAERAVHLLEFMVNKRHAAPEFQLVLNKILCGLDVPVPIADGFDPTDQEIEAVHGMLEGMIGHWKIIGNTSVTGLRSSFLQRQGYLTLEHDAWHLQVEGRSFDMLLDQLPWSIAVIKHPWMTRVLHVNWR